MPRTAPGRRRAVNMMRTAPTSGAAVRSESTGQAAIIRDAPPPPPAPCSPPAGGKGGEELFRRRPRASPGRPQEREQDDADRDTVEVVLRPTGLHQAEPHAGPDCQRAGDVDQPV